MNTKAYITPALHIVKIHCESLIADSLKVDPNATVTTNMTKDQGTWGDIWGSDEE